MHRQATIYSNLSRSKPQKSCLVYERMKLSEGKVDLWCREFKNGYNNVHDEQRANDIKWMGVFGS